jgi:acyl dehydratase
VYACDDIIGTSIPEDIPVLNYSVVKNWNFGLTTQSYAARDSMLYALGIGIGADPLDGRQLRYVYEKDLQTVPTIATVLGTPGFWWRDSRTGVDCFKIVHASEAVRIFKPMPSKGTIISRNRVVSISDKGPGKGAIVVTNREIADQSSGELLAEVVHGTFLRGDGGYSKSPEQNDPSPHTLPAMPDQAPTFEVPLGSLERQALIYRLSGDYNALHADPDVAKSAGFERPILHGLCTFGMAAHAVMKAVAGYDGSRIRAMAARFTAPVYPGETLIFQLWPRDSASFRLRARIESRDVFVLDNGIVELD